MKCNTSCIYGGYSGGRGNQHFFERVFAEVFEKGGFACACFSGKENIEVGFGDEPVGEVEGFGALELHGVKLKKPPTIKGRLFKHKERKLFSSATEHKHFCHLYFGDVAYDSFSIGV